ncbi:peptidylprolyl isomerase [Paenibacillus whitsoniae]|uniref:Peptidylprolyl isomerase n=1 Tax=Paenibacillus whitsoniae TaxID=2496558 RepID=A0A430JCK8_9BACL|nr:hypothetical protein [Paenibacillus whitsoniae]RTE08768.1 hypothetical protein EJQ19_16005 [Paenibacillus whitsoniae]
MKISAILAVISISSLAIYLALAGRLSDRAFVAEVNGSPVTVKEFRSELERQRASVIDSFHRLYGAEYGNHFWQTSYNGETPEAAVKQRALDEIVKFKVELELAEQHGLVQGTSYEDLQREMAKENGQREAALKAKQPIYGPVQLDESAFRNVYISKLRIHLKEMLSESELKASDEELKRYDEQLKGSQFIDEDKIRFQKISVSYRDAQSGGSGDQQKQAAKKLLDAIRQRADQGTPMNEAVKKQQTDNAGSSIRYTEEELNANTAGSYFKTQPMLFSILAGGLQEGEISGVFEEAVRGEYVLIQITGREASGSTSFDKVENDVRKSYVDQAYAAYLTKLADEARVEINSKYYARISMP